ncbi:CBS domain-containing protein [Desulfohalobiaceae bacterium Ax17]|jgi:acetoin utilization protein AcuB|uniref:CBS and ACT domain-containing protein n=1 Tax=Desulfovulcanus ferrireducens TaxID=2831190 RepID=UPI00207BCD18|nr:CBS and ACT domain-containing protein [Desulfovulcanus ferrireducens]MBT8764248.1 CBS domain-containing protein [Desulfovulcanus ferrireducens]
MLIKDWMTKDVITVTPDTSMMKASKILKDKNIRRLPVVDERGKLVGIVTDRDIKEASPSKATTLDVHELYYLLSEIKVKDIMTPNPYTININDTVEKAAAKMLDKKIEGLPVVDDDQNVVGIITDTDIFKVLVNITGVYLDGVQMGFKLPNEPGSLKKILDDLRAHKARIISILSAYEQPEPGFRHVYIRIHGMEKAEENKLRAELEQKYDLLFWVRDHFYPKVS